MTKRDVDWIPTAPVQITEEVTVDAGPDEVWAVIADHESWPEWFTTLKKVELIGSGEGVGSGRRVFATGLTAEEEFLVWEPGQRFAFTLTGASAPGLTSMVEDIRLTDLGDGRTTVTYTQALDAGRLSIVGKVLSFGLRKGLRDGLAGLQARLAA